MLSSVIAFADRYKAIPMFMGGVLAFGTGSYKAHQMLMGDDASAYLVEEQKRMAEYHLRPASYYVKYHRIVIEGRDGNTFKMNSLVTRDKQEVRMTWQDTASFRDAEGKIIPRTTPCQPFYPSLPRDKIDCEAEGLDGWFQHQYWRELMPKKDGASWEPWEYKQAKIPAGAATIRVCSRQEIRVYTNFLGTVDKTQTICTDDYRLSDIEDVSGE